MATSTFNPNDYLMDLKGKVYLQVAHRLLWLNQDVKDGLVGSYEIETDLVEHTKWEDDKRKRTIREAVFRATIEIRDAEGEMLKRVTGWGSETDLDFGDYREKAETKAIGRAVALAGYGTQHAPEFDEGERSSPFLDKDGNRGPKGFGPVDGPVGTPKVDKKTTPTKVTTTPTKPAPQAPPASAKDMTPERMEMLSWLKERVNGPDAIPEVRELVGEILARLPSGTAVSQIPDSDLQMLFETAMTLSQND